MGRIKRSPKRGLPSNPSIAALVATLVSAPDDELPAHLSPVLERGWQWPRTDLQQWIRVLNRFDSLLEQIVTDYDLASMEHGQTNGFTPRTKDMLKAILGFTKLLLENSTNRKIFNSLDRLTDLLHTSDTEILLATLKLALVPAQQYSASSENFGSFGMGDKRLLALAQGWGTRDHNLEMVDLAGESVELPPELGEVEWQFYKKAAAAGPSAKDKDSTMVVDAAAGVPTPTPAPAATATPLARKASLPPTSAAAAATPAVAPPATPARAAPTEGFVTVSLGNVALSPKSAIDLLVDAATEHTIPEPERLGLFQRIRIAKSLAITAERRQLLQIRLLAIAVFVHTVSESTAGAKLFLYEPELVPQLAELVHPDREVPMEIQAAAFYALDAVARLRSKTGEVAAALNAGVSHGILMYVMRRTVADLERSPEESTTTPEFLDALFNIFMSFQSSQQVGNMLVGAGVVALLVDFARNKRRDRLPAVTRATIFLDSLMYASTTAFNMFNTAQGLKVWVDRVEEETRVCIEQHGPKAERGETTDLPIGLLSFDQAALLKALLRALSRLMQTSGAADGLRNLIDTSLLKSIEAVFRNRAVFGPQILCLAINIMASFVHNEPTSLAIIQEAKLPETLYAVFEQEILPSVDVITTFPNAIGALCLNEAGLKQFNEGTLISQFFSVFSSEKHVKVLVEREHAQTVGGAFDELVRHHPSLKGQVLEGVMSALRAIKVKGMEWTPAKEKEKYYVLEVVDSLAAGASGEEGTAMEVDEATPAVASGSGTAAAAAPPAGAAPEEEQAAATPESKEEEMVNDAKDNTVLQMMDVLGRFLEGLFQNTSLCKEFVKLQPFDAVLDLVGLPAIPFQFPIINTYDSMSSLLHMLVETSAVDTIAAMMKRTRASLDKTSQLWKGIPKTSRILPLTTPTTETKAECDEVLRDLIRLFSEASILRDAVSSIGYTHGSKSAPPVLNMLAGETTLQTIRDLGEVWRWATVEGFLIKSGTKDKDKATDDGADSGTGPPSSPSLSRTVERSVNLGTASMDAASVAVTKDAAKATPATRNRTPFVYIISLLRPTFVSFAQALEKMFPWRRTSDVTYKSSARGIAKVIAEVIESALTWPDFDDDAANAMYGSLVWAFADALLWEERNQGGQSTNTTTLIALDEIGALERIMELYSRFQSQAADLVPAPSEAETPSAAKASGFHAIRLGLVLLARLANEKPLSESGQTSLLASREQRIEGLKAFDPAKFLIKVRHQILPILLEAWKAPWLRAAPPKFVRLLVTALINILKAEGETTVEPRASSSHHSSATAGLLATLGGGGPMGVGLGGGVGSGGSTPVQAQEARVTQLMEMGFPRRAAQHALTRYRNNVGAATEYLLMHPDVVGAMRDAEAAEPPAPAAEQPPAPPPVVDEAAALPPWRQPQGEEGGEQPVASTSGAQAPPAASGSGSAAAQDASMVDPDAMVAEPSTSSTIVDPPPAEAAAQDTAMAVDVEPTPVPEPPKDTSEDDAAKEAKQALDALRQTVARTFVSDALSVAEDFPDIVFEIKTVFGQMTSSRNDGMSSTRAFDALVDDLVQRTAGDLKAEEKALATRFQFVALVIGDAAYRTAITSSREKLMSALDRVLRSFTEASPAKEDRPPWLASAMLAAEALFAFSDAPESTAILEEGSAEESLETISALQGPAWESERKGFFDAAMQVLKTGLSTRGLFLSTLRILVLLTRQPNLAESFVEQGGIETLLAEVKPEKKETERCRPYVVIILRHTLESRAVLRQLMEREISNWFKTPSHQVAEVNTYVRGMGSVATRDSRVFLEATRNVCDLVDNSSGTYQVVLKDELVAVGKKDEEAFKSPLDRPTGEDGEPAPMVVDDAAVVGTAAPGDALDSPIAEKVVHHLISEIMASSKQALAPLPELAKTAEEGDSPKPTAADVPLDDFFQTSFALSALAEISASYVSSKSSFLSYSTRPGGKVAGGGPPKVRATFLYYLLSDLVPVSSLNSPSDSDSRKQALLSQWASLAIVGLCYDPYASSTAKSIVENEMLQVRRTVLDAIAKAFKEATASTEAVDQRYGRLFSLSELCFRLLTPKPFPSAAKASPEMAMQMARLMLERNFAVLLTNALADVDLNFPSVHNLINSILRPLEQLTKIVTKIGRTKTSSFPNSRGLPLSDESSDNSSIDEDDDSEDDSTDEGDEMADDAADVYRNSALGMYEGQLEAANADEHYASGDSEGEYDDEEMADMEDGPLGDSDVSDMSDDDEHEIVEMIEEEAPSDLDSNGSGDSDDEDGETDDDAILLPDDGEDDGEAGEWDDVEDLDEDGLMGHVVEDGGDEEDDEGEDDEGDEMELPEPVAPADAGMPPPVTDDVGEDGQSDDEQIYFDDELEFDQDVQEQAEQLLGGGRLGGAGFPAGFEVFPTHDSTNRARRTGGLGMDLPFGAAPRRSGQPVAQAQAPAPHPLLVDEAPAGAQEQMLGGGIRGMGASGEGHNLDFSALTDLLGHLLGMGNTSGQITALSRQGNHLTLGMPMGDLGAGPALLTGRGHHHHHQPSTRSTTRQITERLMASGELVPVPTTARWQEESRMLQGMLVPGERSARLINQVTNALLGPYRKAEAAREAAAAEKAKEKAAARLARDAQVSSSAAGDEEETEPATAAVEEEEDEVAAPAVTAATSEPPPSTQAAAPVPAPAPAPVAQGSIAQAQALADALAAGGFGWPPAAADEPPSSSADQDDEDFVDEDDDEDDEMEMDDLANAMNLARNLAGLGEPVAEPAATSTSSEAEPAAMAAPVDSSEPAAAEAATVSASESTDASQEASGSNPPAAAARVTITVHGQTVDITDTGIDPEFLEALPDDMREEVLNQHFRETRSTAPAPPVPSSMDSEFLDALPPELRAEMLRQEAASSAAAAVAAPGAAAAEQSGGPVDLDPADFFASLDPALRMQVLMEQDEGFLNTLPPALMAEANAARDRARSGQVYRTSRGAGGAGGAANAPNGVGTSGTKRSTEKKEAIQVLEKPGLATLVRLLFFPHPLKRHLLQRTLVNLAENSKTRSDLVSLLLNIAQDGTRDVTAVDKSFSQMSLKASKSLAGPKDTPRSSKAAVETPGGSAANLPRFPGDNVPNLIAQRCLEALMHLVSNNDQTSALFMMEQEGLSVAKTKAAKKGKGKEKAQPPPRFPIVVLLSLLDRPSLLKTPANLDALVLLLATITKSLSALKKTGAAAVEPAAAEASAAGGASTTGAMGDDAAQASGATAGEAPSVPDAAPAPPATTDAAPKTPAELLKANPPQIAASTLRLVVNILDAGECSSKAFQNTLALIHHLSYLPGAREVISDELQKRAQGLCNQIEPDLDELIAALAAGSDVRVITLAKFSPAASLQAKFLRILKTLDVIYSPKKGSTADEAETAADAELIRQIYDSFFFQGLWKKLGQCLSNIEEKPEMLFVATVLLPSIEALMVVSKYVGGKKAIKGAAVSQVSSPAATATDAISLDSKPSMEALFLSFTDEHRGLLNTMVRNSPSLMSGSFAILAHNVKVLDFDNKRSYFFSQLHDRSQRRGQHFGPLQVNVRRAYVFEDSFYNLQPRRGDEIKYGKLSVRFYDEEGVDAGGVTREWFSVLARQMFNPNYALFQPQAADALTYQPNKSSSINPDHLSFFKFVGRIIGKAIYDQRVLEAYFSRFVYKHILELKVDHKDLESIDPDYHKSLVWMLENDIDGVIDLTFSIERDEFGVQQVVDLKPNGRNIVVTNENKGEYVQLIADQRMSEEIKDQIKALKEGLYDVVPKEVLKIFTPRELELLISGLPEIDVDSWRAHTDYHGYTATDPVVQYFWRAVRSFSQEEKAKLLQFVSGSSRVPLEGFGALQGMSGVTRFSIHNAGDDERLPTSHTCYNQLDLARFKSYESLRRSLMTALNESQGFGFA